MKRSSCEEHDPVNAKSHRHLSEGHMLSAYSEVDRSECRGGGCQRWDPDNRLIGYRIWCGTERDAVVGDFIRRHQKDIVRTFESASKENVDVVSLKFNIEMEVKFTRNIGTTKMVCLLCSTRQLDFTFRWWRHMWTKRTCTIWLRSWRRRSIIIVVWISIWIYFR